jgi:hypothetical protein
VSCIGFVSHSTPTCDIHSDDLLRSHIVLSVTQDKELINPWEVR